MNVIESIKAPAAIGPYSQAVAHGNLLFVSGQLPIDPVSSEISGASAAQQIDQCLKNIAEIAKAAGSDLKNTLKTTILLTDLAEFAEVNDVYARFFSAPYPARACYQVMALPKGARVEVEAIVALAR